MKVAKSALIELSRSSDPEEVSLLHCIIPVVCGRGRCYEQRAPNAIQLSDH